MKSLVLLHGWGVLPRVFDELRAALAREYDVRAPALAGYDGAASSAPYDLDALADQIAAAAPDRCFVAGWSLGGQVALTWAKRAPHQIERMALIATTPCFVQRETWTCAIERAVLEGFAADLEIDASRTLARFTLLQAQGDARSKAVVASLRRAVASDATADAQALRAGLGILLHADLRADVHDIDQPALVIHGENDALIPLAAASSLASTLPRGSLMRMRDAAHAPFVTDPGTVASALREFFA